MSKMTFSDEEIDELLKKAESEQEYEDDVEIDERTFKYWMKGGDEMPIPSVDFKYGIYMLKRCGYGDRTDQYLVLDKRSRHFSVSLPVFLDMDEHGELPEEVDLNKKKVKSSFRRRTY